MKIYLMRRVWLVGCLCGWCLQIASSAYAQPAPNMWNILAKVSLRTEKRNQQTIDVPVFGDELRQWNGKEIVLKGYIIPLEELRRQHYFVLSRYPFSLCYFCGGAGIETVIEVNSLQSIPFTEEAVTLKGILQLNETNPQHLIFRLKDAMQIR